MLEKIFGLLPPEPVFDSKTIFVVIEGLAFNGRGQYALQLAGLGYLIRRAFWKLQVQTKDVAPTQAKKFLTGKGNIDKNLILKEVFKRYRNADGTPIDVDDDNIADAVNFNMIGRALLGWTEPSNATQRAVIDDLRKLPKVKGKKSRKAA